MTIGTVNNLGEMTMTAQTAKRVKTKYPKHGTRNILKWYEGTILRSAIGPNGPYVTIQCAENRIRTLLEAKMIEPVYS
jgi:hypothetical protein